MSSRVTGQVRIVGTGLLGASIGHALVARGVDVILHDASRANVTLAIDYGAGRATSAGDSPSLVVVAVPPDVTAAGRSIDAHIAGVKVSATAPDRTIAMAMVRPNSR